MPGGHEVDEPVVPAEQRDGEVDEPIAVAASEEYPSRWRSASVSEMAANPVSS